MNPSRTSKEGSMIRFVRLSVQLLALLAVMLAGACNLSQQEEALPTATPTSQQASKPVVTILQPLSGSEHRVNTELLVSANVRDAVGVTRVTMTSNGAPVKTVSSASPQGDTDKNVVLNYTPLVVGDVQLQIIAYRGEVASDPATLSVRVVATQATPTSGVVITQGPVIDPNDPTCRAHVNSPLNFRTGPGTNYNVITTLSQGQIIPVTGRLGDNSWYQLNFGNFGWVSSSFVSLYGSLCVNVPIIAPPPPPTPNVTATFIPTATFPPTIAPTLTNTPGTADLLITLIEGGDEEERVFIPSGQTSVNAEILVFITNNGSRGTGGGFVVSLRSRDPDRPRRTVNIGSLRQGESVIAVIDYTFDQPGLWRLEARVDVEETVTEISEANNRADLQINVIQQ
jgi:hypothetical protein